MCRPRVPRCFFSPRIFYYPEAPLKLIRTFPPVAYSAQFCLISIPFLFLCCLCGVHALLSSRKQNTVIQRYTHLSLNSVMERLPARNNHHKDKDHPLQKDAPLNDHFLNPSCLCALFRQELQLCEDKNLGLCKEILNLNSIRLLTV